MTTQSATSYIKIKAETKFITAIKPSPLVESLKQKTKHVNHNKIHLIRLQFSSYAITFLFIYLELHILWFSALFLFFLLLQHCNLMLWCCYLFFPRIWSEEVHCALITLRAHYNYLHWVAYPVSLPHTHSDHNWIEPNWTFHLFEHIMHITRWCVFLKYYYFILG